MADIKSPGSTVVFLSVNLQVPPRLELGSLDSKSRVLTITPWNHEAYMFWHLFQGNATKSTLSFVTEPIDDETTVWGWSPSLTVMI